MPAHYGRDHLLPRRRRVIRSDPISSRRSDPLTSSPGRSCQLTRPAPETRLRPPVDSHPFPKSRCVFPTPCCRCQPIRARCSWRSWRCRRCCRCCSCRCCWRCCCFPRAFCYHARERRRKERRGRGRGRGREQQRGRPAQDAQGALRLSCLPDHDGAATAWADEPTHKIATLTAMIVNDGGGELARPSS